jgi:hypothetical protein
LEVNSEMQRCRNHQRKEQSSEQFRAELSMLWTVDIFGLVIAIDWHLPQMVTSPQSQIQAKG